MFLSRLNEINWAVKRFFLFHGYFPVSMMFLAARLCGWFLHSITILLPTTNRSLSSCSTIFINFIVMHVRELSQSPGLKEYRGLCSLLKREEREVKRTN